ncbi:hydroxyethylthiazole kinase [Vagococcus vulneris]|uniref:Hydroxyethylthiazole kinase n=1 Tax=Vagococcus vulneris TaxID=1977869 RepID=A0A429ZZ22_9ENTE|nr:hydroxyethylthiazole kinase [Vagococcus vulneris]RST99269.1 hydroxyethylthiazole kinase [Vagococcus vulneris]
MVLSIQEFKEAGLTKKFLTKSPLIQCITNEITCETMANSLLYIGAKPIMADDPREFGELFQQIDALLLNLGHISPEREENLVQASSKINAFDKPVVVDLVGVGATQLRLQLGKALLLNQPDVVKGNMSEMRSFCGLASNGKGVDGSQLDQTSESLSELTMKLKELTKEYPNTVFLATGPIDLVVSSESCFQLSNGVPELDSFTGTGDIVGAIIAACLTDDYTTVEAVLTGISYFNICGEKSRDSLGDSPALADFRHYTLNHLSVLKEGYEWVKQIKGVDC